MTRLDDRYQSEEDRFAAHPIGSSIRWGVALIVIVIVLGFVFTIGHFALGWFNKAAEVAGPQNVSAQYQAVIGDWNAMQAEAANYCSVKDEKSPPGTIIAEGPSFAYAAKYRQTAIDFNTRQQDIFEAKAVGPSGYPQTAPTLDEMTAQVC